jgi:hypothetical protein
VITLFDMYYMKHMNDIKEYMIHELQVRQVTYLHQVFSIQIVARIFHLDGGFRMYLSGSCGELNRGALMKNPFKKAVPTSSSGSIVDATQAAIDRVDRIPNDSLGPRELAEIKSDLKTRLQEVQKTLSREAPPKEPPALSVDKIVNATQAAIDRVDQIPNGSLGGYNLEEVKRDLKSGLAAVMERASELAAIINNMQAIRNEIFRPVINETKLANSIAKWGLVIAVLALAITALSMIPHSHPVVVSNPAVVAQSLNDSARLSPVDVLNSAGEATGQPSYAKIRGYANEMEGLLSAAKPDSSHVAKVRKMVISELREMEKTADSDPKTLAAATYTLLLCAAATNKWDDVSMIASTWTEKNTNSASGYAIAIKAYEAEALARRGMIAAAVSKYDRLRGDGLATDETAFLSPFDFQSVEGIEFVTSRLEDLKLQQDIANRVIWIFDMDGNSGTMSAKALTGQGLISAVAKGTWPGKPYHAPYVYCKQRPNVHTSEKWRTLVSSIAQGGRRPTVQYFSFSSDRTVREQFETNPNLDVIIILPSMPKAVRRS